MWENAVELKEMLGHLEGLKAGIMKEINMLNANENAVVPTSVYPLAKVKPTIINNYPVFQFSYQGMLPYYKEEDYEYLSMIRHYYFRATLDGYDFDNINVQFDRAVILFVQYFKNNIIRDLENRNKSYIQNAIRHTGIVKDDDWSNVWNMDMGFLDDDKDHVQVYVVSTNDFADFYSFLMRNHENMRKDSSEITNKEHIFLEYQEEKRLYEQKNKSRVFFVEKP